MTGLLQFACSSIWHFLGTEALICTIGAAVALPAQYLKRSNISVFNSAKDGNDE